MEELTERQLEVLWMYIQAGTTAETGRRLGVSEQTVKNTLTRVRRKVGVKKTLQAVYKIMSDQP